MRRLFSAIAGCFVLSSALAAEPAVSAQQPSELARLEQVLSRAQDAKTQGGMPPERYEAFLVEFRASLDKAWELSPRAPADTAAYARIQVLLGDASQAMGVLGPALKANPDDADLRLTMGEVALEKRDFPAATAEADAVLTRDPANARARALKRSSEGRVSGVASKSQGLAGIGAESGSALNDPRVVEAGRRALDRKNALHFLDRSMTSLKLKDPREALRYLALAEVSAPDLADVPMQQGMAYLELKEPGKAHPRLALAEKLWTAQGDSQAGFARKLKNAAAEQMRARASTPTKQPASDSRGTTWPLAGAGVGLLLAGFGTALMKKDEERDDRWRGVALSASLIGIGVMGGGLLGYGAYVMAGQAAGGTMALAGGGTMTAAAVGEGALVAAAAGGAVGGVVGSKVANETAQTRTEKREVSATDAPGRGPRPGPFIAPVAVGSQSEPDDCSLRPGEDVLARFIDGTRLAPGFLPQHEGPGHTMGRHVSKKPEYLRERLRSEGLEDASTFFDQATAERIVRLTVQAHEEEIFSWFPAGGLTPLSVRYSGNHLNPIGNALSGQNPDMLLPKYDAVVRLRRTPRCQIYILTAFPE